MKFSLRLMLIAITCMAFFFGGWIGHSEYLEYQKRSLIAKQEKNIAAANSAPGNALPGRPPAPISTALKGIVNAVSGEFIAINLGTDDGLKAGMQLSVLRGNQVIGQGIVTNAESNRSAAKLMPQFSNRPAREGDLHPIFESHEVASRPSKSRLSFLPNTQSME